MNSGAKCFGIFSDFCAAVTPQYYRQDGEKRGVKGEYRHSIDSKGRLFMPAKFREELGQSFIVTKGLDSCLFVYSNSAWEVLEQKICALPLSKSRDLQRFFFSSAAECLPDSQGRILLPANLREYAGLSKDASIIGVSGRVEIWDSSKWNDYNGAVTAEAIADAMEELGF